MVLALIAAGHGVVIADDPVNSLTLVIKRLSYADADFQLKYIIDTIIDIGLFNLQSFR